MPEVAHAQPPRSLYPAWRAPGRLPVEGEGPNPKRIFTIEGRGGAAYWEALKVVLGSGFPGRTGRGGSDPINVALNYGYGILYAAGWGAIAKSGLDPGIGMLHASPGDRGSLVFDLVEPFRVAAVDRPVVSFVSRGKIIRLNRDGHLTASARGDLARLVGAALSDPVSWGGCDKPLSEHIRKHASGLAIWLQGGRPLRALRIRW